MNKLKELFNSYFWLIVIAFLIFVGVITFLILTDYQDGATNRVVNSQTNQANATVKEAVNAQNVAVNADIERRAEDAIREKVIQPKLDTARKTSRNSKAELDAAKRRHQENAKTPKNFNRSVSDNCAELVRLYPDIRFEYCQP